MMMIVRGIDVSFPWDTPVSHHTTVKNARTAFPMELVAIALPFDFQVPAEMKRFDGLRIETPAAGVNAPAIEPAEDRWH